MSKDKEIKVTLAILRGLRKGQMLLVDTPFAKDMPHVLSTVLKVPKYSFTDEKGKEEVIIEKIKQK